MPVERRQKMIWGAMALSWGAAAAIGLLGGLLVKYGRHHMPMGVVILALVGLAVLGLAAVIPYWRRLDHMARDAHLTTYYWAGHFGALVGLLASLAIDPRVNSPLFHGALLVVAVQYAAAILYWLGWWVRRLPRAS